MQLAKGLYHASATFPEVERFGLTIQMRRAVVSIPSNIAEGCGKASEKEFARFLQIALGSCYELETQIILAGDIGFLPEVEVLDFVSKLQVIQRKTASLIKKLQ